MSHVTADVSPILMENIHLSLTYGCAWGHRAEKGTCGGLCVCVCDTCDPKPDSLFLNLIRSNQQVFFQPDIYLPLPSSVHSIITLPSRSQSPSLSLPRFLCPLTTWHLFRSSRVGRQHTFHLAAEFSDPALLMADKSMLSLFPMPLFPSISLCYLGVCEEEPRSIKLPYFAKGTNRNARLRTLEKT